MDTSTLSPEQALIEAKTHCGGASGLAARIQELTGKSITRAAVSKWSVAPPRRVLAIEEATGGRISRYQLRPDVYGTEPATQET